MFTYILDDLVGRKNALSLSFAVHDLEKCVGIHKTPYNRSEFHNTFVNYSTFTVL